MRAAVIVFPGSNCDRDAAWAWEQVAGVPAQCLWHDTAGLSGVEAVILPGGFAYGDYLRCGALCRFSPAMRAVVAAAGRGLPVLGICNGFQILCEAGLLPGALTRNRGLAFRCETVHLRVENADTAWSAACPVGAALALPIAHGEGCYWLPDDDLAALRARGGVVFRYCGPDGRPAAGSNPNGSLDDIAGVANAAGNVVGLMPHPERAVEALLGGDDGACVLRSVLQWAARGERRHA